MSKWILQSKLVISSPDKIIRLLLKNRGIKTKQQINQYLNPSHPLDITLQDTDIKKTQMDKAIKRIIKAVDNKESTIIFGDYDADGICATAILWETLYEYNQNTLPYIPHRENEGYGLSQESINILISKYSPKLIITVDNGVTAKDAVAYAKKKGIDVIICDHHLIPEKNPNPHALVHTTKISGSGVTWFTAKEFIKTNLKEDKEKLKQALAKIADRLELAAIGTVADILPLTSTNRAIVAHGLAALRKTRRYGLRMLFDLAGIKKEDLDVYHIGYIIAPRINAAGRISHALESLRLLCTTSITKAKLLADKINETNKERQLLTEGSLQHALEKTQQTAIHEKIIITGDVSYNQGIIGLVAGKLTEKYYKPSIVFSIGKTHSKASARSIQGINIITVIRKHAQLLVDYGGHPMAAGFTIKTDKIELFTQRIIQTINETALGDIFEKELMIDCQLSFADITIELFDQIQRLKPFGSQNREPIFTTTNITIEEAKLVGSLGKHTSLKVNDKNGIRLRGIFFNNSEFYQTIKRSEKYDIAYTLTKNNWNGTSIELKVKDIIVQNNS